MVLADGSAGPGGVIGGAALLVGLVRPVDGVDVYLHGLGDVGLALTSLDACIDDLAEFVQWHFSRLVYKRFLSF